MNNRENIIRHLKTHCSSLGLDITQAQTLLCQERFVARLATVDGGQNFIWKGGSLILRLYQNLPKPRFTVDIDFLARGISMAAVDGVIKEALSVDFEDGFLFDSFQRRGMSRETPYGGDRYSIDWTLFGKRAIRKLKN